MTTTERGGGGWSGGQLLKKDSLDSIRGRQELQAMNTFQYDGGPGVGTFNKQGRVEVEQHDNLVPLGCQHATGARVEGTRMVQYGTNIINRCCER